MDNTVYIHLGPAKTGTSAIQHFLGSQTGSLSDSGYVYAHSCRCPYGSHNPLAWILYHKHTGIHICRESKEHVSNQDKILYDFAEEIEASRDKAFILSSETFPGLPAAALDELLGFFEGKTVKAVLYIRNVQALCLSLTMQHIKEQNFDSRDLRMKNLFETIAFEYRDFTDLWASRLGKENLIFRKYGRDHFDSGNICADILKAIGIDSLDRFEVPEGLHNVSLRSAEALCFKDILNRMNLELPENEIIQKLIQWERENEHTPFHFPPRTSRRIAEAAEKTHKYMLDRYLQEDYVEFFKNTTPPAIKDEYRFDFMQLVSMLAYLNDAFEGFGERFMGAFGRAVDRDFEERLALHNFLFQSMKKATLVHQAGRDEEAVKMLLECIRVAPEDRRPYYALSEMYIEAGKYGEALDILKKTPGDEAIAKTMEMTGYCMEKLGRLDEATRCAEQALATDPASAPALNLLGVLAYRADDAVAAERFFKQAVEACPEYGESYSNLGALKWENEKREALDLFEKAFILGPTVNEMIENYHAAVVALEEYARAEKVYGDASSLYPHSRMIKEKLADVRNRRNIIAKGKSPDR